MVNYEQQQRVNFEMEGEQDSGDFLHPEKCFRSDHRCTVKKKIIFLEIQLQNVGSILFLTKSLPGTNFFKPSVPS